MENRGGRMHSHVHTELYVHTICKKYDEQNRGHVCRRLNDIICLFCRVVIILFRRNEKEIRNIRNYDGAVHDSGGRMRPESRK